MRKILLVMTIIGLLLLPLLIYAQSDQTSTEAPPVAQPLVREGDFAMKLVDALEIGTAKNEAEAETMLGSSGIAPKNGWIANYPVTPDIVGELQSAIGNAADNKRLPMGKDKALKALTKLSADLGLPVIAETGEYAESQPPKSYEYTTPTVVNNYYYEEGPPVITYYPPPWDYWYLYSWVPRPFFFGGFFFSGFFALHDFHRVVIFANNVVVVSNHVISPVNHTVVVIDPPTRATGKTLTTASVAGKGVTSGSTLQRTSTTGFSSPDTRKAATSILQRSQQRLGTSGTTAGGRTLSNSSSVATGSGMDRGTQGITGNRASTFNGTQGRQGVVTNNRGNTVGGRTFSNSSSFATGSGMDHRSSQSFSRSFSTPSSRGSGHSFSGFSGAHASGGFSGGHSSGGFSGGGHGGGGGRR